MAKTRIDVTTPEAAAMRAEIYRRAYVREGTFVALPTCFPGVTTPIVADEGRITALDIAPDGTIYGGTSGHAAHIFAGLFTAPQGAIFDLGAVDGADECVAVCCGQKKFAACVNGPGGGRAIARDLQELRQDLIQEWGFIRQPFQDLGPVAGGERIVHAVADKSRRLMVGATTGHLFTVDLDNPSGIEVIDSLPGPPRLPAGAGRLAVSPQGDILGLDEDDHLWRFDPSARKLHRKAVKLPKGNWGRQPLVWARSPRDGWLFLADGDGRLFASGEGAGIGSQLALAPLAPVTAMACAPDGRVFGFCGREMSRMFCVVPATGEIRDLGVAVSVIQTRRYGYQFADALTGPDGQLFFAENDDGGHLWMYFPKGLA
ncbi:MAG: hypothetical protein ACE15C_12800 [Phycisphaerae bacterium]